MTQDNQTEEAIFDLARRIDDPQARREYVAQACGHDMALKERVLELLDLGQQDSLFDRPPVGIAAADSDQSNVGSSIGPYQIREEIGEGGMGVVYVAEQTEPVQRKVALKIIKPGMDTKEVIARFEAERQALAFMEHPNIARVLDAGETDSGRSYFVMELVRGIPITEYCDQIKATTRERLELFKTVCDAVQHAHQKGIIHRDIKPSNVLVTQVSAKPVVKVIDFGLAKATSGQKLTDKTLYTGFMKLMGTPVYMSPEQAGLSGLDIDTRSDVYSLGILLYELLTGTTPLDKTQIQKQAYDELCRKIRELEAPKPSARISTLRVAERSTIAQLRGVEPKSLCQLLDGDLDVVVLKSLEKDRDRRYATPQNLANDIDRFLNEKPVEAVPPSALYIARKYIRRHKVAILTAACILTSLVLATSFSTWQAIRATRYGKESELAKQEAVTAKRVSDSAKLESVKTSERRRRELYVANMQLAAQIWSRPDGSQRQVDELLAAWIPVDGKADLREFTWRHQWSLLHQTAMQTVFATSGAAFSQDGNFITASEDGIRIWNESGRLIGHPFGSDASNASLSSDGQWAVLPREDVIQLIDVSSGTVAHKIPGEQFSLSSNNQFLASWQSDGEVSVWDIAAKPPKLVDPLRPTGSAVQPKQGRLLMSADGTSFLIRGPTIQTREFDIAAYLAGKSEPVIFMSAWPIGSWDWSADGSLIAIGSFSGRMRLRRAALPEKRVVFGSHGKQITALAFSPDAKVLASGGGDGSIELWNVAELLKVIPQAATSERAEPNAVQPLGPSGTAGANEANAADAGATPDDDDTRRASTAYEIMSTATAQRSIKAHVDPIRSISFSSDGSQLASTDGSGVTKRWDVDQRDPIPVAEMGENPYGGTLGIYPGLSEDGVTVDDVFPDEPAAKSGQVAKGDRIVGIADGAHAELRRAAKMQDRELFDLVFGGRSGSNVRLAINNGKSPDNKVVDLPRVPSQHVVTRVAFSPTDSSLALACIRLGATLLDTETNQARRLPYRCVSVAYSPDGRFLAMDHFFEIAVWDLQNDRLYGVLKTRRVPLLSEEWGASMAFSPDGRYLAAGTGLPFNHSPKASNLYVWDIAGHKEIAKDGGGPPAVPLHETDRVIVAVAFTPDGESLVAADHGGTVRIWDTNTWSLEETLEFPDITAMDVSHDGRLLALGFGRSASPDSGIVLWDFQSRTYRRTLRGHRPMAVAFSPDGRTLASTSQLHDVVLWDVATGKPMQTFAGHAGSVLGAAFSADGTRLATTDTKNLRIRGAATLEQIDRHPLTLRSLFRLGVAQNRERRFAEAEATLRRVFVLQTERDAAALEISQTEDEIAKALEGQGKLSLTSGHSSSVERAASNHPPPETGEP